MMQTKYYIGTSGWVYPHWKEKFYPGELPQSKWFDYYCGKFNCVEINATFYRSFKDDTYKKWYDQAPEEFKYVLKAHRIITHRKYLKDVNEEILRCWNSALLLREKLGMILLQLPPQMTYDLKRLETALEQFPSPAKIAVEFRNDNWLTPETKELLTRLKCSFCTSDAPDIGLADWMTGRNGYIRLHGHDLSYSSNYSTEELQNIAALSQNMSEQGAKEIYIFFNNDVNAYAPFNALELKKYCG